MKIRGRIYTDIETQKKTYCVIFEALLPDEFSRLATLLKNLQQNPKTVPFHVLIEKELKISITHEKKEVITSLLQGLKTLTLLHSDYDISKEIKTDEKKILGFTTHTSSSVTLTNQSVKSPRKPHSDNPLLTNIHQFLTNKIPLIEVVTHYNAVVIRGKQAPLQKLVTYLKETKLINNAHLFKMHKEHGEVYSFIFSRSQADDSFVNINAIKKFFDQNRLPEQKNISFEFIPETIKFISDSEPFLLRILDYFYKENLLGNCNGCHSKIKKENQTSFITISATPENPNYADNSSIVDFLNRSEPYRSLQFNFSTRYDIKGKEPDLEKLSFFIAFIKKNQTMPKIGIEIQPRQEKNKLTLQKSKNTTDEDFIELILGAIRETNISYDSFSHCFYTSLIVTGALEQITSFLHLLEYKGFISSKNSFPITEIHQKGLCQVCFKDKFSDDVMPNIPEIYERLQKIKAFPSHFPQLQIIPKESFTMEVTPKITTPYRDVETIEAEMHCFAVILTKLNEKPAALKKVKTAEKLPISSKNQLLKLNPQKKSFSFEGNAITPSAENLLFFRKKFETLDVKKAIFLLVSAFRQKNANVPILTTIGKNASEHLSKDQCKKLITLAQKAHQQQPTDFLSFFAKHLAPTLSSEEINEIIVATLKTINPSRLPQSFVSFLKKG